MGRHQPRRPARLVETGAVTLIEALPAAHHAAAHSDQPPLAA
jgi:hypothetical protein